MPSSSAARRQVVVLVAHLGALAPSSENDVDIRAPATCISLEQHLERLGDRRPRRCSRPLTIASYALTAPDRVVGT